MYTNITLNTLPLRKSYGIPILIVHLEMQFFIRIYKMDVIAKLVLARGSPVALLYLIGGSLSHSHFTIYQ